MENYFAVNIGRQLGSGGHVIGEILSKRMNLSFYDKELINLASEESGLCKEIFEKADERVSSGFAPALGMRMPFMDFMPMNDFLSNDALFKIQSDVIQRLVTKSSCLFVGRCADYILRGNPYCVNIFIHAPMDYRVEQVMQKNCLSKEKARTLIEKVDKTRSSYYNYYTDKRWGDSSSYHLSIDSTVFGLEETADYIEHFIRRKIELSIF